MDTLRSYRDDGPLAHFVARALPLRWAAPPIVVVLGVAPLAAALAVERRVGAASWIALGWYVLLASGAGARATTASLDWLAPVILRAAEYGFVVAATWVADPGALPAAYALLFAVSIHHYEVVYRIRHLQVAPPRWVGWAAGGWEARMLLVAALSRTGMFAQGMYAFAVAAGLMFVIESVAAWVRQPDPVRRGHEERMRA